MHPRVRVGIAICWAGAVVASLCWQLRYETTPAVTPDEKAIRSTAPLDVVPSGKPSLILALHPRCPCSRATVAQLHALVQAIPVQLTVLVTVPVDAGPKWTEAEICRSARSIPRANVVLDPAGRVCARLGVHASGHVLAYDAQRSLVYSGGVTAARGQAGPNPAVESLRTLLLSLLSDAPPASPAEPIVMPTFGCELVTPDDEPHGSVEP